MKNGRVGSKVVWISSGIALLVVTLLIAGFVILAPSPVTAQCGGQIRSNVWVTNQSIKTPGQTCRYLFDGQEGAVVSIAMSKQRGSSLDSWLDLVDPYGFVAISDDDSYGNGDALIANYRLRQTGRYAIIARGYNNASSGSFAIYLKY